MEIEIDDTCQMVCIWLPGVPTGNFAISKSLQIMMDEYKKKKYRFVIFESGKKNLIEGTKELLLHNKKACIG